MKPRADFRIWAFPVACFLAAVAIVTLAVLLK